jgi:ATP/maltotriose-dependent transcriptional regulator MalT
MGVSLPTAKFHLRNLYRKLGAEDRRTAVHVARDRALVEP